jgi:hypothetical protein
MISKPVCQECGNPLSGRKSAIFCDAACRLTFNNRRMQRGAELYDLFRALRRERGIAKLLGLWTWICRLELEWNMEDERARPGRKSYMEPKRALDNLFDKGSLQRGDVLVQDKRS